MAYDNSDSKLPAGTAPDKGEDEEVGKVRTEIRFDPLELQIINVAAAARGRRRGPWIEEVMGREARAVLDELGIAVPEAATAD